MLVLKIKPLFINFFPCLQKNFFLHVFWLVRKLTFTSGYRNCCTQASSLCLWVFGLVSALSPLCCLKPMQTLLAFIWTVHLVEKTNRKLQKVLKGQPTTCYQNVILWVSHRHRRFPIICFEINVCVLICTCLYSCLRLFNIANHNVIKAML